MLRVLKDCILHGESVHKGECFCAIDFDEADIQVIVGAGYAEFIDDVVEEDDAIAEDPEDFAVEPVKPVKKTTAKKKATKKTAK